MIFFFKQETAYEMRISDWSSDVCSSDLQFALESTQRAIAATKAGAFNDEIMPLEVRRLDGAQAGEVHTVDEGIRFDATLEAIASVKLLAENGRVTAAPASQICDGASAVVVVNRSETRRVGKEGVST